MAGGAVVVQATAGAHAAAAGASSLVTTLMVYPLSSVSLKLQVQRDDSENAASGVIDTLAKTLREEGVAGVYSGVESALVGSVLSNVCYYYWYTLLGAWFKLNPSSPASTSLFVSALAGWCNVVMTNPVWVANNRYVTASAARREYYRNTGLSRLLVDIAKEEGPAGLMRGVLPALVLVANPIITYTLTENLKQPAREFFRQPKRLSARQSFLVASVSKLVATTCTHPMILLKTRLQQADQDVDSPRAAEQAKVLPKRTLGPVARAAVAVREIITTDGFAGLYRGLRSKVLQSVLQFALLFMLQDQIARAVLRLLAPRRR
eukprot:TRINITY_DN1828_c0_g1_i1.p1 TRINITY_DN1828_c0_g1~~TRINITY_DN1828_c0_g1_i1.p1  ORF type:complete len:338 (+),score=116.53 TRINITY_DN1828_c0_g1_i1:57-1016(+)